MQVMALMVMWAAVSLLPAPVEAAVTATCGADAFEPNDARARAKSTRGKRAEARVCRGDVDWYYVKAEAGQTIEVVVEHDAAHPVEVGLFPPRARAAAGETETRGGRTTVRYVADKAAKHRVRVASGDGSTTPYAVEISAKAR
ncbi:MAG: hypothetical protein R3F65_26375 [bacterium]